jgi:RimJ/RimL family protein N-acetyltransferase
MHFNRFGIQLRSLREPDLEMVRNWRNAPHVRNNMEFQEEITPEMHQKWFAGLSKNRDLYLIAEQDSEPFAVLHVKEINWEAESGEAGIFVGEKQFLGTLEPVLAVLAMMDMVFFGFGMRQLYAKIHADRPKIMDFNRRLGYAPLPGQQGFEFIRLQTTPEAYLYAAKVLRRQAFHYQTSEMEIVIDQEPFRQRWAQPNTNRDHLYTRPNNNIDNG